MHILWITKNPPQEPYFKRIKIGCLQWVSSPGCISTIRNYIEKYTSKKD